MYTGPKLTNKDLVFGYDTGYGVADNATATRFYLGEPTVNLVTNGNFSNSKTGWGFTNVANSATSVGTYQGRNALFANGLQYYNQSPGYFYQSISVTQGVQYTISFKYYLLSGTLLFDPDGAYNGGGGLTQSGQWVSYSATFTASTTSLTLNFYGASGVLAYYYITDIRLEAKSHTTPYVSGTRSSTASLIDLAKTTDIDVSNVSFDSTGQPEFDGTNDMISLGDLAVVKLGKNFTIEVVVKPEQDKWMYFFHKGYGGNNALAWGRHSSGDNWFFATMIGGSYQYVHMGTATLNVYHHLVATYDGTNLRCYENGDHKTTSGMTHNMMTSTHSLGIGGADRYWNGEIPVTKVYSRVLTAAEITSNFNAYKNRFNI